MRVLFILFVAFLLPFSLFSQSAQGEYLEAKRLFKNQQYSSAKGAFGALTEDEYFGRHASFYYAMSAYRQGDYATATDMLTQLAQKYPKWEREEVTFWLAYISLENSQFDRGISFAEKLSKLSGSVEAEQLLYGEFIAPLDLLLVSEIHLRNEENKHIAFIYTQKLLSEPYETRDFSQINQLNAKWDFSTYDMQLDALPTIKKESYNAVVAFPFMYDSSNLESVVRNSVVMELYQGMQLATAHLKGEGIVLNLLPIDTKRSGQITENALSALPADEIDLIVGPLISGPNDAVKAFSIENKINMINPVSSTSGVIAGNQFGFLFKPSYETMAVELADAAIAEVSNPNTMIFYENNSRDSTFAAIYKARIEQAGFNVVWFQELNKENSRGILDTLTAQYELFYSKAVADSIMQIPGRFVKSRRLRKEEIERIEKYVSGENPEDSTFYKKYPMSFNEDDKAITYYENLFYMEKDSIGHILGATSKNYLANNLISAVETKGDSTMLFGYGEWLDFTMVSYNQLERLGVSMTYPDYFSNSGESYDLLESQFLEEFGAFPSAYQLLGYELIWQMGHLLHEYGKYFQNGLMRDLYYPGVVYEGIRYGAANDNQIVPVVRFENAELKVVNKQNYEDR